MFAFDITFVAYLCFFLQRVLIICPQNSNYQKTIAKMYFENVFDAMVKHHLSR